MENSEEMNLENLNKEIIPDPLTGDFQTIYWNDEHTFMMSIPHKGIQMSKDWKPRYEFVKTSDDGNGKTTWERKEII